jgi:hypothetical protein
VSRRLALRHRSGPGRAIGARESERGFVGGIEVLPFGLLVFVTGALLIVNAWAVVDAKLAVTDAAREAGRAYVESASVADAAPAARRAAEESIAGHGRDPTHLVLVDNGPDFVRCARVVEQASYTIPALTVPFIGGFGRGLTATARHAEIIDPYADGRAPGPSCGP